MGLIFRIRFFRTASALRPTFHEIAIFYEDRFEVVQTIAAFCRIRRLGGKCKGDSMGQCPTTVVEDSR